MRRAGKRLYTPSVRYTILGSITQGLICLGVTSGSTTRKYLNGVGSLSPIDPLASDVLHVAAVCGVADDVVAGVRSSSWKCMYRYQELRVLL